MVNPYRSAEIANRARKPGRCSSYLAVSAIAFAAAIASASALAQGKGNSANAGPAMPQISHGAGTVNKQANLVLAAIPAGSSSVIGNSSTPPSSGTANVIILPSAMPGAAPANSQSTSNSSGTGMGMSKVETGGSGPGPVALPVTAVAVGTKSQAAGNSAGAPLAPGANDQRLLAPGESIEIADPASPGLRVEITPLPHQSLDIGKLVANAERSGIYSALAARSGQPRANGATRDTDGRVLLTSSDNRGKRGEGAKIDDSPYGQATGKTQPKVAVSPKRLSEESDREVSADWIEGGISLTVNRQINADRDLTSKTREPIATSSDKRDSNRARSNVCS